MEESYKNAFLPNEDQTTFPHEKVPTVEHFSKMLRTRRQSRRAAYSPINCVVESPSDFHKVGIVAEYWLIVFVLV